MTRGAAKITKFEQLGNIILKWPTYALTFPDKKVPKWGRSRHQAGTQKSDDGRKSGFSLVTFSRS